jgi:hypothetical protein
MFTIFMLFSYESTTSFYEVNLGGLSAQGMHSLFLLVENVNPSYSSLMSSRSGGSLVGFICIMK